MANKKISALTELTATPADTDVVPVVDVSDTSDAPSGTTKRVSVSNLLAAGSGKTYTVSAADGDSADEEKIRLSDSDGTNDDVVLEAGTGLSISRSGDKITFTNSVTDTDTVLTEEQVQDIVGAMVEGNTETNISVTYDDSNGKLDFSSTDTTYSVATTSADGLMSSSDKTKLDGIESSADVTDTANVTAAGALMDSELTDLAGVKGVTISTLQEKPSEGAFADGDKTKLDGIESNATADQTDAEIRTAVGNATDSNVFTDADHSKLDGIESGATADQTGAEIKTAYEAESDTNAFTDADHAKLDGIASGAEVNVQADWDASSGDAQILNKPTIPSNLSDLSDVDTTSPSTGQVLKWGGSSWGPGTGSGGTTNLSASADGTSLTVASSSGDDASIPAATTSAWGAMTDEDKTKLDGIDTAATANDTDANLKARANHTGTQTASTISDFDTEVANNSAVTANTAKVSNVTTDLSASADGTSLTVESSDGTNASIPAATTSAWGAMTDEDKTKLDGIASGAEVNVQSDWNSASGDSQILNKPTIPADLGDLDDVSSTAATTGQVLKWNGSSWAPSASGAGGDVNQNAFSNVAVSGETTVAADTTTDTLTLVAGAGISLSTNASTDSVTITNTVTDTDTVLTTEQVQDIIGGMVDNNTETNISVTYDDTNGKLNFSSTDTDTTYSVVTSSADGLAPQLPSAHGGKFLKADGTWEVPPDNDTDTTYSVVTSSADGLAPQLPSAHGGKFLKADGTWEVPPDTDTDTNTTYSVSAVDGDNADEEKIRLTDSGGGTDDVVLEAGTGLSIARTGDKITFTNTVTDTDTVLTTEQVQDIIGAMVSGNTETNIAVTYDDTNGKLNFSSTDTDTTYSVVTSSADGLAPQLPSAHGGKFLKADGTWEVPPDTNTDTDTTYTAGDGLDLSGTEFSADLKTSGGLKITSGELEADEANIDHDSLQNYSADQHRTINDSGTGTTDLWSASKINTQLGGKSDTGHTHSGYAASNHDHDSDYIQRYSAEGTSGDAAVLPAGGTSARPDTGSAGYFRFNTDTTEFEGYDGTAWGAVGGGNTTSSGLWEHAHTISANYTIGTNNNAISAGPVSVNSGVSVTVPSGSTWVVA